MLRRLDVMRDDHGGVGLTTCMKVWMGGRYLSPDVQCKI